MPATKYYRYRLIAGDDLCQLKQIEKSYVHGDNVMATMMDEHHVPGDCPACGASNTLQFFEDDDASPFVISVDARGTYFCNDCEESFIDAPFYEETVVMEYPFPFDASTAMKLTGRLRCIIDTQRVAHAQLDAKSYDQAQEVIDSVCGYVLACFNHENNEASIDMFHYLVTHFSENSITEEMFVSSLRTLLSPKSNGAALADLPNDLAGES